MISENGCNMRISNFVRHMMLAGTALNVAISVPAAAQDQPALSAATMRDYDISAQPLRSALRQIMRQGNIQIGFEAAEVDGKRSTALSGNMSVDEAISRLLIGTGLTYRRLTNGSVVLEPSRAENDGSIQLPTLKVEGRTEAGGSGSRPGRDNSGDGYQGTPDRIYETAGSVSAISRDALRNTAARDTRDMLSGAAGVYSGEGNGSFPTVSPNIRGLQDGGRVVVSIDGARQNAQRGLGNGSSGYQSNAGQAFVDPAFVRMVEIDKNPGASAGSLASLGGSVNFRTVGAQDIIAPGRDFGFEVDTTTGSNAYDFRGSVLASLHLADTGMALSAGISKTRLGAYKVGAHGGETSAFGNFKGREAWSSLLKLEGDFGDLTASVSWMHQEYDFRYGSEVSSNLETVKNDSVSTKLEWNPDNPLIDLSATLWYNNSQTDELREARILGSGRVVAPDTYIDLDLESYGATLQNVSRFETGAGALIVTYGVEAFRDDATAQANSVTIAENPDWASRYIAFSPPGRRDAAGGFVNFEWSPSDFITASAGVRYDWHRLKGQATYYNRQAATFVYAECEGSEYDYIAEYDPDRLTTLPPFLINFLRINCGQVYDAEFYREGSSIDPLYQPQSFPAYDVAIDRSDSAWLPTAMLELHPTDWLAPYASYSKSFRPPTVLEAFFVGGPPAESVGINHAPNLSLRPERARTFEIGANIIKNSLLQTGDSFRLKFAAFDRKVRDYVVLGYIITEEVPDRTYLSFVNLDGDTTMRGLELETNYDAGGFWLGGAVSYLDTKWPQSTQIFSNETITTSGEIFATSGNVPPKWQLTVDAGVRLFDERLEIGARLNHVTPTLSRFLDDEGNLSERTEHYTIVDLHASFRLSEFLAMRAAVTNLTDRNYIPGTAAYNAPGRTFLGSLNFRY